MPFSTKACTSGRSPIHAAECNRRCEAESNGACFSSLEYDWIRVLSESVEVIESDLDSFRLEDPFSWERCPNASNIPLIPGRFSGVLSQHMTMRSHISSDIGIPLHSASVGCDGSLPLISRPYISLSGTSWKGCRAVYTCVYELPLICQCKECVQLSKLSRRRKHLPSTSSSATSCRPSRSQVQSNALRPRRAPSTL
jgi:hypothetical protein